MSSEARTATWIIDKQKILTVPTQNGVQYETGSNVTVSLLNYDSAKLTLGGTYTASVAGNYVATVTPTSNYCWSDGSTSAKDINWTLSKAYKIMTVKIDESNSNPETCCTYADDAVGMTPGSAEWDEFFGHYPVLFKNGAEVVKINPNNFGQDINGNTIDITSGDAGDVMIAFPRHGLRISKAGDIVTVSMTDNPDDSSFKYYAHSRGSTLKDKFYIGAYYGSTTVEEPTDEDSGVLDFDFIPRLRSLSTKQIPIHSLSISTGRVYAQANGAPNGNGGSGYDMMSFYPSTYLQAMYCLKYKNLSCRTTIGQGKSSGTIYNDGTLLPAGGTETWGMDKKNGTVTNYDEHSKLFGIEDIWNNLGLHLEGVALDTDGYAHTTTENFNDNYDGYVKRTGAKVVRTPTYSGNWITTIAGTSEEGFLHIYVTSKTGSSTTYYTEANFIMPSSNSNKLRGLGWGGNCYTRDMCGIFSIGNYYDDTSDWWGYSARLMYL